MNNRPKRRKSNDNPYTLQIINNTYVVIFKDSKFNEQVVEVSKEIFNQFDKFELEDLKELNEYDRHLEHSKIFDNNLYTRAINQPLSLEDEFIKKTSFEELKEAINKLPEIQKRRIKKYYFEDKTEQEIATEEKATHQSVHIILERALKNLNKILRNEKK